MIPHKGTTMEKPRASDKRISIRLTPEMHAKLRLFARGRSNGATPQLSTVIREAIEQYLEPPQRQTHNAQRQPKVSDKKGTSP